MKIYTSSDLQQMENGVKIRGAFFIISNNVSFRFFGSDIQHCRFLVLNESIIDFGKDITHNNGNFSNNYIESLYDKNILEYIHDLNMKHIQFIGLNHKRKAIIKHKGKL